MTDVRNVIVDWAKWAVNHKAQIHYSMGADRSEALKKPGVLPMTADCSFIIEDYYYWAGAPDPSKNSYASWDYTGTLIKGGTLIKDITKVLPGDILIVGPDDGDHAMLVVANDGKDPLCVSHGQESDPSLVHASQDHRQPHRYFRYDTTAVRTIHYPPTTPPTTPPSKN